MTFSTEIKEAAQPIIEEIYNDGFIQDLLKGFRCSSSTSIFKSRCIIFERIYKFICTYPKSAINE